MSDPGLLVALDRVADVLKEIRDELKQLNTSLGERRESDT